MRQNQPQLRGNAFGADDDQLAGLLLNGRQRLLIECEIKASSEPHRSQHSQLVFRNSLPRIANCLDDTAFEVVLSADEVDDATFKRIVKQTVDREIAPLGVGLGIRESHRVRMPAVAVCRIAAKRCHIDLPRFFWPQNRNDAKRGANRQCSPLAKNLPDALGRRIGRHIVVLGHGPHELIAHAPACPQRLLARLTQAAHDVNRKLTRQLRIDGRHRARD
jgi:hypothetical protein